MNSQSRGSLLPCVQVWREGQVDSSPLGSFSEADKAGDQEGLLTSFHRLRSSATGPDFVPSKHVWFHSYMKVLFSPAHWALYRTELKGEHGDQCVLPLFGIASSPDTTISNGLQRTVPLLH